ncbi:dimethylaniline monooxygenase [N-oxide-forming] 2-like [Physella acuta]|uniref:dimethylaniline monooxygenase [N-oxide-forming] 2-like n=1 Tax=Physella acuta TaxID=109671 RepID=UPI0027DE4135|nr:dimethylaniline monooxygenase [N-oxide-forming] 2-like [Physella acuta]
MSGLVAIKECLNEGFKVTCYELDSDVGGIWSDKRNVKHPNTPQIWENLITNSSKYLTTFSDYPPLAEDTPFLRGQICKTRDHKKTGQWEVFSCPTSRCSSDDVSTESKSKIIDLQKCKQRMFDFVLICNGFFKIPVYPSIPGLETFAGTVQHSFHYTDGSQFKNKNVLVVGNSFSAGDISFDISTQAKQVHISLRQGTWIVPRILSGGRPLDICKRRCDIYSWNPEKIINTILISEAQNKIDHVTSGICPDQPPSLSSWMTALMSGQIKTYGHLARIDGCDAVFQDGTRVTGLDAIVLCTGYEPEYSFLDQDLLQEFDKMGLYKMVFPIDEEKHTLGFIGAFGGFSSIVPMSELQLPCLEFQDTIAKLLGVFPGFWRLLIVDPVLAFRCWYGPMFSAQYRLLGPDSNWNQARDICYTAYTEEKPMIDSYIRYKDYIIILI